MISVTRKFTFESAHNLPHYEGKCHNIHGHSYTLEVTVSGNLINDTDNPKCGMIIDFHDLDALVKDKIINVMDHTYLNDIFSNPTAENMVLGIFNALKEALPTSLKLVRCRLWETDNSYAECTED